MVELYKFLFKGNYLIRFLKLYIFFNILSSVFMLLMIPNPFQPVLQTVFGNISLVSMMYAIYIVYAGVIALLKTK